MPGPIPTIVRDLVLHPFFQHKVSFNKKRMQDHNLAAKLLMIEHKNAFVDTKARNLDDFTKSAASAANHSRPNQAPGVGEEPLESFFRSRDRVYDVLERINPYFGDRDTLLGAQGHIPVYYWIARQRPDLLPWLNAFLREFTRAVRDNLRVMRTSPANANQELSNYYTMGRTTNDQGSLRGRYDFLVEQLESYSIQNPR